MCFEALNSFPDYPASVIRSARRGGDGADALGHAAAEKRRSPNDIVFDYTADGVRRSIEDSLQRLGVDSLDVAFVHDISPDFAYFPNGWEEQYEIARRGAFPALSKMRDEGIIRAWGMGREYAGTHLKGYG